MSIFKISPNLMKKIKVDNKTTFSIPTQLKDNLKFPLFKRDIRVLNYFNEQLKNISNQKDFNIYDDSYIDLIINSKNISDAIKFKLLQCILYYKYLSRIHKIFKDNNEIDFNNKCYLNDHYNILTNSDYILKLDDDDEYFNDISKYISKKLLFDSIWHL
jgi:hypothetical protein